MNRSEELAVGRRLLGHIDGRTTDLADAMFRNRVSAYSCRDRARLERDRLFRDQPIFMGLSTRLPKPGDYLTEDVAGMPALLTRGADGAVKAFANICRHRGAPVAQGRPHGRRVADTLDREPYSQLLRKGARQAELEPLWTVCSQVVAGWCVQHDDAQFAARADLLQRRLRRRATGQRQGDRGRRGEPSRESPPLQSGGTAKWGSHCFHL